eukprot:RCo053146
MSGEAPVSAARLAELREELQQRFGVHLGNAALEEFLEESPTTTAAEIQQQLLEADLRSVGMVACIPKNIGSQAATTLKGKLFLQVMKVRDVTVPLRRSKTEVEEDPEDDFVVSLRGDNSNRLLRLELTDGTENTLVCVELPPMPSLREIPLPGSKVLCTEMQVKSGMGLLSDSSFESLGGSVEALSQEYNLQKEFEQSGGVSRGCRGGVESAPPFVPFEVIRQKGGATARPAPSASSGGGAPSATTTGFVPGASPPPHSSGRGGRGGSSRGADGGGRSRGRGR